MHTTYKFTKSILPLDVRLCLNPLIGVAHHGDEKIDQDNHGDEHVDPEGELEESSGPLGLIWLDPELTVSCLAEDREEQVLECEHRSHSHCNQAPPSLSNLAIYPWLIGTRMSKFH